MANSAAIICVGSELVRGRTQNTNSTWISRKLEDIGVETLFHISVLDDDYQIQNSLDLVTNEADIIVFTGGLGPTDDDHTKQSVSNYFGLQLIENENAKKMIIERYKKLSREMPLSNLKQSLFPEISHILPNKNGTAPGCFFQIYDKVVCLLPGPPSEMKPMFLSSFFPVISKYSSGSIDTAYVKVFGIGESKVEELISDIIRDETKPEVATYFDKNEILITVRSTKKINNVKDTQREIMKRLGSNVFSTRDESLPGVFVSNLRKYGYTLSVAESCSGGLLSSLITEIPGASEVFFTGLTTYSNASKISFLGVHESLLDKFGAVSEEVAVAMVEGLSGKTGSDVCISITGIAGPGGAVADKPVGTVYIGYAFNYKSNEKPPLMYSKMYSFTGDRKRIQTLSSKNAMLEVINKLNDLSSR